MKKVWIWLGVVAVCVALGFTVGLSESTAMKGVQKGINQDSPLWKIKEVVGTQPISEKDSVMFYFSEQNSLVLARLHETWYGRWQMLGGSGSMPPPSSAPSPKISVSGASYKDAWIVYGAIYSDDVHEVRVDRDVATIIGKPGQTRVYCLVLPTFSGALHAQAYDKQGNLLEER